MSWRSFKQSRGETLTGLYTFQCLFIAIGVSLLWFRIPETGETLRDRTGAVFFSTVFWTFFPAATSLSICELILLYSGLCLSVWRNVPGRAPYLPWLLSLWHFLSFSICVTCVTSWSHCLSLVGGGLQSPPSEWLFGRSESPNRTDCRLTFSASWLQKPHCSSSIPAFLW